jgi:hypothetical protein
MKRLNNLRILIVTVILTYNAKKNSAARSRIMNGRTARPRKGFFVHTVFLHILSAEIQIQKISTISIGFGNQPIAHFFHDQTICIADRENLTIGHSLFFEF